jgi:hypothetical protein
LSGEKFHVVFVGDVVLEVAEGKLLRDRTGWKASLYEVDFDTREWKTWVEKDGNCRVQSIHRVVRLPFGIPVALGKLEVREYIVQKARRRVEIGQNVAGFKFLASEQRRGVKSNVMSAIRRISFDQEISRTRLFTGDGTRCPECSMPRCDENCPSFS